MPRATRAAAVLLLLLAGAASPAGSASSGPRTFTETGETFRTPLLGRVLRFLVDGQGRKALRDPGGAIFDSPEDAVRAEEASLPLARRVVHPSLWPLLEDPARAEEPVRVVLVLRRQPVRDASLAARSRYAPLVEPRLARLRSALAAIAPHRLPDPDRALRLGDRLEEEARLLAPDVREELRGIRREVRDLLRAMRREILDAAAPAAALDREPVAARIGRAPGGRVLSTSLVLNAVVAEVPANDLPRLAEDLPSVARILPHGTRSPGLDTSVATLGATTWTGAGYDGSSATLVSILDTGIDAAHPAVSPAMGDQAVFLAVGKTDPTFQDDANSTDDIYGHGTHVAGIVMSRDATFRGVAPGGVLLNAKCGYRSSLGGNLQDGDIMAAGDWSVDRGADAVNASFGGGAYTDGNSALSLWFDALVAGPGVFAAVAAGNSGPGAGTVGSPGDAFNVVTAGSLNDAGTPSHADNSISSFSSRGPLDDGRRKPDLCAPGSGITSCNYQWEGGATDFVAYNGTSMATPHVAGAAAILLDYAASWSPEGLKALLLATTRSTAPYPASPDNTWGWGAADLAAAFTWRGTVLEGVVSGSGAPAVFVRMPAMASGRRAALCWNRDVSWNDSSTPSSHRALADLDLAVYEEADQSPRGTSAGSLDSVERVALTAAASFPLLKVKRAGSLPSGQSAAPFAVAAEASGATQPSIARPPALACSFVLGKPYARAGDVFTVDVTLTVGGDLPAFSPTVALSLPPGYALESGSPVQALADIAAGSSRTATWSVVAGGDATGPRTFSATGACTSYGESFLGPASTADQAFDAAGPTGTIVVQAGSTAVAGTAVTVAVYASDDSSGVTRMRVRNDTDDWGPWQPFAASFPWTLPGAEGVHEVGVQLQDAAGNASGVLTDSVFLDGTAPTGSFLLAGGAPYAMPWEVLAAATAADDGEGSGISGFRVRWGAGAPWSEWIPLDGGPEVPVPRPPAEEEVRAEGQFRDAAGNPSPSSFDGIHLVPLHPPSLAEVRAWTGRLPPGDIDSFDIGLLPGDVLTVRLRSAPAAKGGEFLVDVDLFDPSGAKVAAGRYPEGAAKPGIAKFVATLPGRHWIVLRPAGADAAAGGTYALSVRAAAAKANRRVYGPSDPVSGISVFAFAGTEGSVLSGALRGPVTGEVTLESPGGAVAPLPAAPATGGVRVAPARLGETGTYVLRIPAAGPLLVDLKARPPRRTRAVEPGQGP